MSNIYGNLQQFALDAVVELFVLDATSKGAGYFYFHAGTNELKQGITWQGQVYTPLPLKVDGFEMSGTQFARPKMQLANVDGVFSSLVNSYSDLVGCKVIRKRTLTRYLDAVNFADGNPTANPLEAFADDIFYITRKSAENRMMIEFELGSSLDLQGVMLPRRQVIASVCCWRYRSEECGYTGGAVAKADDTPTTDINQDSCSHKVSGCKLRYGENGDLRIGCFVGASLIVG